MAERAGRPLLDVPTGAGRAQPLDAELALAEPRVHADDGVVACHVVAADRPQQAAAEQREPRAPRLAAYERSRLRRDAREQPREPLALEVMHEQVREHDRIAALRRLLEPLERVR